MTGPHELITLCNVFIIPMFLIFSISAMLTMAEMFV